MEAVTMEQRIREFEAIWNTRPVTRPVVAYEHVDLMYRGRMYRYIRDLSGVLHLKGPLHVRYEDYEDLEDDDEW